jgi:hypothetical protein
MNKQELISMYERISNFSENASTKKVIANLRKLDEPQACHADVAPRYLRNVIARLRELPSHDREVWLKAIMGEFEQDFSHAKWREGYEQGKFEGAWVGSQLKGADKIRQELNKPVIPKFVANWYEEHKGDLEYNIWEYLYDWHNQKDDDFKKWMNYSSNKTFQTLVNMHQFGYTVEEEHKYNVKFKGISGELNYLNYNSEIQKWYFASNSEIGMVRTKFTRKELEYAGFGEVFNSPLFEVEEVKE